MLDISLPMPHTTAPRHHSTAGWVTLMGYPVDYHRSDRRVLRSARLSRVCESETFDYLRRFSHPSVLAVFYLPARATRTKSVPGLLRHLIRSVASSVSRSTVTARVADLATASSIVVSAWMVPRRPSMWAAKGATTAAVILTR